MGLLDNILQKANQAVVQPAEGFIGNYLKSFQQNAAKEHQDELKEAQLSQLRAQGKISPQQNQQLDKQRLSNVLNYNSGAVGATDMEAAAASKGLNFLQKAGENIKSDIGKVQAPDIAKSLQGVQHTQNIQDALRRNGVNSLQDIGKAAQNLYQKTINPILGKSPKPVAIDDVTNSIVDEMKKIKPGLEEREAKNAASGVINDLYGAATRSEEPGAAHAIPSGQGEPAPQYSRVPGSAATEETIPAQTIKVKGRDVVIPEHSIKVNGGNMPETNAQYAGSEKSTPLAGSGPTMSSPTHIDTSSLFKIKQDLNQTDAVNSFFNGNPITNLSDLATVASRNALSGIIEAAHPEIAQATRDYGLLKDAVPSLYKASQQGRGINFGLPLKVGGQGIALTTGNALGGVLRNAAGSTLQGAGKVAGSPLGKVLGAGALVAGGVAGDKAIDFLKNANTSQANNNAGGNPNNKPNINGHDQSVSQNRYKVNTDPVQSGQLLPTSNFTQQDNALNQQIASAMASGDVVNATKLKGQQQSLENTFLQQKPLREAWTDPFHGTGSVLAVGNKAFQSIQNADPGFFNLLSAPGMDYDKLMNASNGKYAGMAGYLSYISNATGVNFTGLKTKDALVGALDSAMNNTKTQWETLQQQYGSGGSGTQNQQLKKIITGGQPAQASPQRVPQNLPPVGGTGDVNMGGANQQLQQILGQ